MRRVDDLYLAVLACQVGVREWSSCSSFLEISKAISPKESSEFSSMRSASVVLMLCAPCVAFHLPAAAAIRPTRCIAPLIMKEGNSAGKGFGKLSVEEEAAARGREQLEALRAATSDRGYDSTLQGLQDKLKEPEATAEELEQFKSQITLGLAGFLILGGVLSLVREPPDCFPHNRFSHFRLVIDSLLAATFGNPRDSTKMARRPSRRRRPLDSRPRQTCSRRRLMERPRGPTPPHRQRLLTQRLRWRRRLRRQQRRRLQRHDVLLNKE